MIHRQRLTATLEGDFVVFLIGMRINRPLRIDKWLPVIAAMPPMIRERVRQPELGFLYAEMWFGRTTLMVQYWRSMEQLLAYARHRETHPLPAWQAFNKTVGTDSSVGIWHETYAVAPDAYENSYVNMPAFGLGRAGTLQEASGSRASAAGRLRAGNRGD
jgi:hypothetical protein